MKRRNATSHFFMKRYFFLLFSFFKKSLLRLPPFLLFKFGRHARDDDGTGTGHHHHFGSLKLKSREIRRCSFSIVNGSHSLHRILFYMD